MNSTSAQTNPLAVLDSVNIAEPSNQPAPAPANAVLERIMEAYSVAQTYATQIQDPDYRKNVEDKLVRSNVRGSMVVGVKGPDDVAKMFASVTNWREVPANLKDKEILVLEGDLPASYTAFAAYATLREVGQTYGSAGVGSVQPKIGYQKEDEYYFCTMLRFETNKLTVQLKKDAQGFEHVHQWFAGREVASIPRLNDGDTIVRCGVQIQRVENQRQTKMPKGGHARKDARPHRVG